MGKLNTSKRKTYLMILAVIAAIVIVGAIWYQLNQTPAQKSSTITNTNTLQNRASLAIEPPINEMDSVESNASMTVIDQENPGVYDSYSENKVTNETERKIVLFFNASWCPSCRATDKNIRENINSIPSDVIILSTDYDKETSLRQKYGVTTQHTFVHIDNQGKLLSKAIGLNTLDEISEFAK